MCATLHCSYSRSISAFVVAELASEAKLSILKEIGTAIEERRLPYLMAAELTGKCPEELKSTGWTTLVVGAVVHDDQPTMNTTRTNSQ